uniref:Uncharacterized protein n=1 Tax=Brassica campestris TaxID=3711 RepID=M4EX55_BRACM
MASHSYPTHGFSVQGINDITKNRAYLVNPRGRRQEIKIPENSFDLKIQHLEPSSCKPLSSLRKSNHFLEFDSTMMKPNVHETGQEEVVEFLLSTTEDELKERGVDRSLLSHLDQEPLKKSARWRKLSRLVPQFSRLDSEVLIETLQPDEVNLDVAPQKTKTTKPSRKKQNPKLRDGENDLYKRNHLHACESLISLMLGSEQHRQTTMLSLKKKSSSCGDLSELLTRLSIAFAGTGIAVFFSVVCSAASGRVPFCANTVFDAGLSLSLVLLSWAVSRLGEAVVGINRKVIKGEETTNRVESRIKDVYFRAATVIIMVALRFH